MQGRAAAGAHPGCSFRTHGCTWKHLLWHVLHGRAAFAALAQSRVQGNAGPALPPRYRQGAIYRVDGLGEPALFRRIATNGFSPDDFETRQVFVPSKDGTKVSHQAAAVQRGSTAGGHCTRRTFAAVLP